VLYTPPRTLDDVLGGALPGRIHSIAGPPGSGKTSAALHFLRSGIEHRHRCVLVTSGRVGDLVSHADFLGLDLRRYIRARRLTLLRYGSGFSRRVATSAAPAEVVRELGVHAGCATLGDDTRSSQEQAPVRIVVDSLAPFLASGHPSEAPLAALADWLDDSGATVVLTWTGDVADCDRRLDPIIDRSAVILRTHLVAPPEPRFRADIVRARHAIASLRSVAFDVMRGVGVVAPAAFAGLGVDTRLTSTELDRPPA